MSNRLYNEYGSTKLQFDIAVVVDQKIRSLVSELMKIMKEYDVDPRDFKTYCMDSMDLDFAQFFCGWAIAKRKENIKDTP